MTGEENYIRINRQSWDDRLDLHLNSAFYDVNSFLKGKNSLQEIELKLLGGLQGKSVLHLQCHFGQDTISLSRLGAKATGVDFSENAIDAAREMVKRANTETEFICSDVYALPHHLHRQFDIVFTSYGTIGWLPDMDAWAKTVSVFLKPGGKFVFVEFHPVVWMFDKTFEKIEYSYFNTGAIEETETGTYADPSSKLILRSVTWNHSQGEVLNSLIRNHLEIQSLDELDYSPWNCFSNTVESEPGKFRIKGMDKKIPMVYAIAAVKK